MKKNPSEIAFLPHSFKKIAIVLFIISIPLSLFLRKYIPTEFPLKIVMENFLLIGILFFIYSKGKAEDEMTLKIRYSALLYALQVAMLGLIIDPYTNYILGDGFCYEKSVFEFIVLILLYYIMINYGLRYLEKKE